MIWVTHDPFPFDLGGPGGPAEMSRMLCFQFADGSGGTEWPVDADWRPPGGADGPATAAIHPTSMVLIALLGAMLIAASSLAFRKR